MTKSDHVRRIPRVVMKSGDLQQKAVAFERALESYVWSTIVDGPLTGHLQCSVGFDRNEPGSVGTFAYRRKTHKVWRRREVSVSLSRLYSLSHRYGGLSVVSTSKEDTYILYTHIAIERWGITALFFPNIHLSIRVLSIPTLLKGGGNILDIL